MVQFPQCLDCTNFIEKHPEKGFICKAFPNGIPEEIFWNKVFHTITVKGDHEIIFEPIDTGSKDDRSTT